MSLRSVLYQQENGFIAQRHLVAFLSHLGILKRLSLALHVFHVGRKHALLAEENFMRLGNVLKILIYRPLYR
jgi:hypothetical protein